MADEQNTWTLIHRVESPQIKVPRAGVQEVSVYLDRTPPDEWREEFLHPHTNATRTSAAPRLNGETVTFDCDDETFDDYMKSIDERIASGNQRYEEQVMPALKQAELERNTAEESRVAAQAMADNDAKKWDAGGKRRNHSSRDW
jgi:hypothetical protein